MLRPVLEDAVIDRLADHAKIPQHRRKQFATGPQDPSRRLAERQGLEVQTAQSGWPPASAIRERVRALHRIFDACNQGSRGRAPSYRKYLDGRLIDVLDELRPTMPERGSFLILMTCHGRSLSAWAPMYRRYWKKVGAELLRVIFRIVAGIFSARSAS